MATKRYLGKGVLQAVENVNTEICEAIIGLDAAGASIHRPHLIELDGTDSKSRLGANAILAVSVAVAKAAAEEAGLPLYRYLGGAGPMSPAGADDERNQRWRTRQQQPGYQEFMIMPVGAKTFRDALRCGAEIFHHLKKSATAKGLLDYRG